jgi:hypothetical protein
MFYYCDKGLTCLMVHSCALAYCIPVLPTSLARWFLSAHDDPKPFANAKAQFTVKAIFTLSGICDVIVFRLQRQGLLLFPAPEALRGPLGSPDQTPPALTPPGILAERGRDCITAAKPPSPRIRPGSKHLQICVSPSDRLLQFFFPFGSSSMRWMLFGSIFVRFMYLCNARDSQFVRQTSDQLQIQIREAELTSLTPDGKDTT